MRLATLQSGTKGQPERVDLRWLCLPVCGSTAAHICGPLFSQSVLASAMVLSLALGYTAGYGADPGLCCSLVLPSLCFQQGWGPWKVGRACLGLGRR